MKLWMIDFEWNCPDETKRDVELKDLMNCAWILYAYPSKRIIISYQCTILPKKEELSEFWQRKENQEALRYMYSNEVCLTRDEFEKNIAEKTRQVLDEHPKCEILLDNLEDGFLLNEILKKYNKRRLNYDVNGKHKDVTNLTSYFKAYYDLQIPITCYYNNIIRHTAFGDCVLKLQKYMTVLDYLSEQKKWRIYH